MDKVQKNYSVQYNALSSETFKFQLLSSYPAKQNVDGICKIILLFILYMFV